MDIDYTIVREPVELPEGSLHFTRPVIEISGQTQNRILKTDNNDIIMLSLSNTLACSARCGLFSTIHGPY